MDTFSRLALGTANFGPQPYGHRGVICPRDEQEQIVGYCMSAGITALHTKPEYGVDLSWLPSWFDIIDPSRDRGQSLYWPHECVARCDGKPWSWVNIPYSPFNRTWEDWMLSGHAVAHEIHVRSVCLQGKAFTCTEPVFVRFRDYAAKVGLPVGTLCILFCLLNPHVDKVIIGVDSEQQLRENLRFFHRLEGFGVDDPNIIDPRKWS